MERKKEKEKKRVGKRERKRGTGGFFLGGFRDWNVLGRERERGEKKGVAGEGEKKEINFFGEI